MSHATRRAILAGTLALPVAASAAADAELLAFDVELTKLERERARLYFNTAPPTLSAITRAC
jgi:hypothetical protein